MPISRDPLAQLYHQRVLNEGAQSDDFRSVERNRLGYADPELIVKEPGTHVTFVDEVLLEDGTIVPADVEYTAEYDPSDVEDTESFGRYTHSAGGWYTVPFKFTIPSFGSQEDIDADTKKPGVFKAGQDVTQLVGKQGFENTASYLDSLF